MVWNKNKKKYQYVRYQIIKNTAVLEICRLMRKSGGLNVSKNQGPRKVPGFLVRMVRVELTRANAHYPLKVACLPFHHIRSCFGNAKIRQFLKIAKFF